jgi:phage-related protein
MDEERTTVRRLRWVGDSREKLQEFPKQVRKNMGHALYLVQTGQTPPHAKPLRGIGSGVFEIVDDYDTNTYRAVYAVKVGESIYFLFQLFLLIQPPCPIPLTSPPLPSPPPEGQGWVGGVGGLLIRGTFLSKRKVWLRPPCVPEEIEAGYQDSAERDRAHQAAVEASAGDGTRRGGNS